MTAKISAILLCGGKGTRMRTDVPKQYLLLGGKPIAQYSFEVFDAHSHISEIVVVCEPEFQTYFSSISKKISFAEPGERRQDSVYQGLQKVSKHCDLISIHDSARPFVSKEMFDRACTEALKYGAATVGVPIPFTAKQSCSQGLVINTLQRESIWEIQTPQILTPEILHRGFAYAIKNNIIVTDDVSLAELIGHPVKIVEGSRDNLKITTPEDLAIAKTFLAIGSQ